MAIDTSEKGSCWFDWTDSSVRPRDSGRGDGGFISASKKKNCWSFLFLFFPKHGICVLFIYGGVCVGPSAKEEVEGRRCGSFVLNVFRLCISFFGV